MIRLRNNALLGCASKEEFMSGSYAADEGRDFLATVIWDESCDWSPEDLEAMDDGYIEDWLEELGYEWTSASWKAT